MTSENEYKIIYSSFPENLHNVRSIEYPEKNTKIVNINFTGSKDDTILIPLYKM